MAHVIYMLVRFLMVKLVILVEIKGRWKKKDSKGRKGKEEKEISCPEFTYIIFHGLLWGVELLVVGTATQGVNQPEKTANEHKSGGLKVS